MNLKKSPFSNLNK